MFLASIAAIVVLAAILTKKPSTPAGAPAAAKVAEPLLVLCAAGLKPPVENIAREFEQAEGVKIQLQFGGSQTLLANLEVSQRGDLFIAAEDFYAQLAREKNLVREIIPQLKGLGAEGIVEYPLNKVVY